MPRRLSLLVLLGGLVAGAPALAFEGFHFDHRDWEVACDNTGTCRAAGYQADGDEPALSVLLVRAAGPDAPVEAHLQLGTYDEAAEATPTTLALTIDGRGVGKLTDRNGDFALTGAPLDALLAALRRDSDIAFVAGEVHWRLSDDGASAVLLKMDEFQGRLGTPGALLRKGKRDEAAVPPPQPAPRVRRVSLPEPSAGDRELAADPAFVRAMRAAMTRDECDESDADEATLTVRRIDAKRRLVSGLCWRAAYNEGHGFWIGDARPPFAATVVTTLGGDSLENGEISAAHKGRGLGDCWSHDTWTWNGAAFIHTTSSVTGQCKLVAPGGTWTLPTIVTEVIP